MSDMVNTFGLDAFQTCTKVNFTTRPRAVSTPTPQSTSSVPPVAASLPTAHNMVSRA